MTRLNGDPTPELSRLAFAAQLEQAPASIVASEAEGAALAERFGLVRINTLSADCAYERQGDDVHVTGTLKADIVQSCVITLEDFASQIDQPFQIHFVAEQTLPDDDYEAEILVEQDDIDLMPMDNGRFDIGEAVAQTLALALDPYPRGPDADATLSQKGILREGKEKESPFAALGALKKD
ncbi:MAG: DUF177 domain-containing protein [Pseudomonadota bacterium]